MNQISNDEILKQVGAVLQFCQDIVTQLSRPPCCCQDSNQQRSKSVIVSNLSNIFTKTFISECDSQYEFSGRSSSESPKLMPDDYATISEADMYDPTENVPEYDIPMEKVHEYEALMENAGGSTMSLRRWSTYYNITEAVAEEYRDETDVVKNDLLSMISAACPNAIYDRNWRENALRSFIHPLLLSVWDNAIAIFDEDSKEDEPEYVPPPAVNIYHTIDLHNVNSRFIENIPKPNSYPVLGVSQDPDFYHKRYDRGDPTKCFLSSYPHGALSGYETNLGIVAPPKEPIHGYIWSDRYRSYVLHAVLPEEESSISRRRRMRKG